MGKKKSSDLRSRDEAFNNTENALTPHDLEVGSLEISTEPETGSIAAGNTVADLIRDLLQDAGEDEFEGRQNLQPMPNRVAPTSVEDLLEDDPFLQEVWAEETNDRSQSLQSEANQQAPGDRVRLKRTQPDGAAVWYLGIDVGTTGISAVLLEQLSGRLYPVYWTGILGDQQVDDGAVATDRRFRLPAVVSLGSRSDSSRNEKGTVAFSSSDQRFAVPMIPEGTSNAIGNFAVTHDALDTLPAEPTFSYIQDFKLHLKLGIPYFSAQTQQWEPILQWTESQQVPLIAIQQALQTLLATLKPTSSSISSTLVCGAVGMETPVFHTAIELLAGVVVGYPSNWSDTYSFNIREAVLDANLVEHPEQIFLIEDTIATLLSVLRQHKPEFPPDAAISRTAQDALPTYAAQATPSPQTNVILHNTDWQGSTLVLNAGATVTELMLVDLPTALQDLQYADFHTRSLPFAGNAIDQDIVCHLLYPLLKQAGTSSEALSGGDRVDLRLEAVQLDSLRLDQFVLPIPGEPDLPNRYRLRQWLESLPSGQILLDAARRLKLAFQQQSRFTLQLGDRSLTILRQDLGSRILLPYVQRLNRELNTLLQQTYTSTDAVNQVICTGGTASIRAIGRWLHEKFPNATIIQDTYAQSNLSIEHCIPSCSRVAYGLAALPLHPQVLDSVRHHYSDYFLLRSLLQWLPDRAISLSEITQILVQHNVEMQSEQIRSHLLALLEGHLPPGLIPTESDAVLFNQASLRNVDFRGMQVAPFCQRQGDYCYPNRYQWNQLHRYLETILNRTRQKLEQPYPDARLWQVVDKRREG